MLTIRRLDISDAWSLISGARAKAEQIGVPVCIAVTDESGNLLAFERMDGGKIPSITIAIDKSYTAAGIKKGTDKLGEANQPGQAAHGISSAVGGRMSVIAGGLPIFFEDEVIGSIGISSGTPTQDLEIAEASIQTFFENQP